MPHWDEILKNAGTVPGDTLRRSAADLVRAAQERGAGAAKSATFGDPVAATRFGDRAHAERVLAAIAAGNPPPSK